MSDMNGRKPERRNGSTPNGGDYSIAYFHNNGVVEIVEFDDDDREITRTYMRNDNKDREDEEEYVA